MDAIFILSEPLLFLVCLFGVATVALIGVTMLWLLRRALRQSQASSLPPAFTTAIVFPAAIVLGLLVNDMWRHYMDAQDVVQQEAVLIRSIWTESAQLKPAQMAVLRQNLSADVRAQVKNDWALFQSGRTPGADQALQNLLQTVHLWSAEALAKTPQTQGRAERIATQLMELQKLRDKRILLSLGKMDAPKWWVVFCLLLSCILVMTEITLHSRSQTLMICAFFTLGSGSLVYMLATHERPFVGGTGVSAQPIMKAFDGASPSAGTS